MHLHTAIQIAQALAMAASPAIAIGIGIGIPFQNNSSSGGVPAKPTLTAPSTGTFFKGVSVTVSATSTDSDLTRIDWVVDPGASEVVVATDSSSPYSTTATFSGVSTGAHTLVARAVRGGLSTDSTAINITITNKFQDLVTSVTLLQAVQSDYGVTQSGGAVSTWADQGAGAKDYTAAGAAQPTYNATGLNSLPTISFNGTAQFMGSSLTLAAPGTTPTFIWAVMRMLSFTIGDSLIGQASATNGILLQQTVATPQIRQFNASIGNIASPVINTWNRMEAWFNNSTTDYLKFGATSVTGTNSGNNASAAGRQLGAHNSAAFANMEVAAWLYFSGKPTAGELSALSAAVTAKYGASVGV